VRFGRDQFPTPGDRRDRQSPEARMIIVNPRLAGGFAGLFNTHPSAAERVARQRALAAG